MIELRAATENDLCRIRDIYNEAVVNTTATFDTEPRSVDQQRAWFFLHRDRHPVWVATDGDAVVGWASLSPWSDRCAYDTTVEISVYIEPDYQGKGVGSRLLETVLREGREHGNHTVLARIVEGNGSSIRIHEKFGFQRVGVMKEVGFKFGRFLDVHLLQLIY